MKKLLFLIITLILVPVVSAQIEVRDTVIKNNIIPDEGAEYTLFVSNKGDVPDVFGISISDINWRDKIDDDFIEIGSGETAKTKVELTPNKGLRAGRYSINLRVYSRTNPKIFADHMLIVDITPYQDLVSAILEVNPNGLDPRKENLIRVNLKNMHNIELKNVNVNLNSALFEKTRTINLDPSELRGEEFKIELDEDTEKGDYELNLVVSYNENVLVDKTERFSVGFYKEINNDEVVNEGFLTDRRKIVKSNSGNVDSKESYKERFTPFESFFTSVYPEPSSIYKQNGLVYYQWDFTLEPGESYKIEVITNYRTPLSILIVLIVVGWLAYFTLWSGVSIKKKVLTVKSGKEIDMKIMIVIRNEGKGRISNINVFDYLPEGANLPEKYGTVKPLRHKKTSRGIALVWRLNEMVGGEERVLSYRVNVKADKSSVLVPRAILKCRRRGRTTSSRSTPLRVRA